MLVYCDIDGVLADCSHRLHYLKEKDYDSFYSAENILKDKPIQAGVELLEILSDAWQAEVIFLTGRPYRTEKSTMEWFKKYSIPLAPMIMRKDGDYRPSDILKAEVIRKNFDDIKEREDAILFIDDDAKNVVAVAKENPKIKVILFGHERLSLINN